MEIRISNKQLAFMLMPLYINGLLDLVIELVDSIMVAHVGEASIAAVSLVSSIVALIHYMSISFSSCGAVLIGQYIGRNELDKAKLAAQKLVILTFSLTAVIAIVLIAVKRPLLKLLFGSVSEEIMHQSIIYYNYLIPSLFFSSISMSCNAVFIQAKRTKVPLYSMVVLNVTNIVGDYILIYKFNMGIRGAAIATLGSLITQSIISIAILLVTKHWLNISGIIKAIFIKDEFIVKTLLKLGVPGSLETCATSSGRLIIQSLISMLGSVSIVANSIAVTLMGFCEFGVYAIQHVLSTVSSQCVGAGYIELSKQYFKKLVIWCCIIFIFNYSVVMILFNQIISLYGVSGEAKNLVLIALIMDLLSMILYNNAILESALFKSVGDVVYPTVISTLCMWILRVLLASILVRKFSFGIISIWACSFLDWGVRFIIFTIHYRKGKWQDVSLIPEN